jgi:hypothetical protein
MVVKIKNKNKVVVVINNNTSKKRVTRRRTNPLSKSQETIIRHQYFNTPIFNPIVPNHAPVGTRVSDLEKDHQIIGLKNELTMRKNMSENHANIVEKMRQTNDDLREELSSHKNTSAINLKNDMDDVPLTPVPTPPPSGGLKLKKNGQPYARQPKK